MTGHSRSPGKAPGKGPAKSGSKTTGAGRFQKGQSGNPNGRPKKPVAQPRPSAIDVVIDRTLTLTRDGVPREITMEEALQHRTYQDAIAGKRMAEREVLKWIGKREAWFAKEAAPKVQSPFEWKTSPDPDNADAALLILGIARPDAAFASDPYYEHDDGQRTRLLLEPWAVQKAIDRRQRASAFERRDVTEILRCTRDKDTLVWAAGGRE